MELGQKRAGDVTILSVAGELDALDLPAIGAQLDALVDAGSTKLVVNLRRLTFIESSVLGWLIETRERLDDLGGNLVIAEPSEFFETTTASLGIARIFEIYPSEEKAVRHFHAADLGGS